MLQREPERRLDKNNRLWFAASCREIGTDPSPCQVRVFAFADGPRDALGQCVAGDVVAASGTLKISPFVRDGAQRLGLTLIADSLGIVEVRRRIVGGNVRQLPLRKA